MFILTAKLPRRRLLAGGATVLCCCLAVLAALALTMDRRGVATAAEVGGLRNNEDRVAYLAGLGWQADSQPLSTEELLIPDTFDDSYAPYLELQASQGFDLSRYCGKRVTRYIYQLTNYPTGQTGVQAALLIYRNRVVGGQIQAADGSFLHGLAFSNAVPSPAPSAGSTPQPSGQM